MRSKQHVAATVALAISVLAAATARADVKPTVTLKPQPNVTVVPHPTLGPTKVLQVRMRWQDFIAGTAGAKRLASLQAAIKKMKSLDGAAPGSVDFRRSWAYWANIHGYYGSQSPDGTVAQQIAYLNSHGMHSYVSYYNGIVDQTPPDSVATTVWATCQHSGNTQALNFFGWHRMYLYYFERVLRWAANDQTLRLPYWDYTNTAQLALPAQFRDQTSVLYDDKRDPSINNGSSKLNGNSTDVDDLLPIANYFDYEDEIEGGIHGYVHCTTGPDCPVAHMGDVPVAGNDPIFYHHHANIDRLWACWQKLHTTPSGSWQNETFSFPDETGTLQTKPVKDFLDSSKLGYVYDHVTSCQRLAFVQLPQPTPVATAPKIPGPIPEEIERMPMVGATKAIAVDRPSISVDMDIPQPRMRAALADLKRPGNVELVLRDVAADSHPGTMFDVFIARKGHPESRQHVGTINWFGAFRHHGRETAERRTLHFDVTDELRALGAEAVSAAGVTVMVEATSGRVPAERPAPGAAAPAAPQATPLFRREANLRIGAIELRSVGAPGT